MIIRAFDAQMLKPEGIVNGVPCDWPKRSLGGRGRNEDALNDRNAGYIQSVPT